MSPLRSSPSSYPIYIPSITGSLSSSDKGQDTEETSPTTQTIPTINKNILSKEQIQALKSGNISLKEFTELYNSVPIKNRNKSFHTQCKTYVYEHSKTKASFEEKKEMFLSLPQKLITSIPIFKLMFEEESIILIDIMSGHTEPKQLQTSINKLLQLLPIEYLKRQICQYVKHRQPLLREDKSIVASCRKQLRSIEKKHTTSKTPSPKESSSSFGQGQTPQEHNPKLHPEAKAILDSLDNGTIEAKDIIPHRKKLILLKVDKKTVANAFRRFRYHIQKSDKQDTDKILQILNESCKQTAKIKPSHTPISDELQSLLDKAHSGTLPLENVPTLRKLLFKEYNTAKAASHFHSAKKTLIRHNKSQESLIQETFKKTFLLRTPQSSYHQDLKTKIKNGNLDVDTFTSIYNSIPQSDKTGTLSRLCSKYIKNLSYTTSESYEDKLKLIKALPISLQKSSSTLHAFFPKESYIISLFKNGSIQSHDIKTYCMQLLKITDTKHILHILNEYIAKNKTSTSEEKKNISDCRAFLKQHKSHQTRKRSSSELSDSPYEEQSITAKRSKPNLHPQAQLILQSLNECSIKTNNIVGAREQLISLGVDKCRINKAFDRFKRKITLSHKPNKKAILIEIDKSGTKSRLIRNTIKQQSKRLSELLTCVSKGTISLKNIIELRRLLFKEYPIGQASSMLYNARITLSRKRPQNKLKIELAFKKARQIQCTLSTEKKRLLKAIKNENLPVEEFTFLYNAVSPKERQGRIRKIFDIYIKNVSQKQKTFHEKIATIRKLPINLQSSPLIIKAFFPDIHALMSSIRDGTIPSNKLTQACMKLLRIIKTTHICKLIEKYINNKQQISKLERQHVAKCRKILLNIQRRAKNPHYSDIYKTQHDDAAYTNTLQHTKSPISMTPTSVEYDIGYEEPVNTLDKQTDLPEQQIPPAITETYIMKQHTYNTQEPTFINPTSSYSIENSTATIKSLPLEQLSSDELSCILQNIIDEGENSEDQIILHQYLLQLTHDIQQELDIVEQTTSNKAEEQPVHEDFVHITEEQPSTSQSCTHTKTIQPQDIHTDEPIPDNELPKVHEDFVHITDMAISLTYENFDQLADTLERTIPLQEIDPEEFFDFSNIDET